VRGGLRKPWPQHLRAQAELLEHSSASLGVHRSPEPDGHPAGGLRPVVVGYMPCFARSSKILNTLLYMLLTGCHWCDFPRVLQWASKSAAHRRLLRWQEEGPLPQCKPPCLNSPRNVGWFSGTASPWMAPFLLGKGGVEDVTLGRKGKDSRPPPYSRRWHAVIYAHKAHQ
jgi:transposase